MTSKIKTPFSTEQAFDLACKDACFACDGCFCGAVDECTRSAKFREPLLAGLITFLSFAPIIAAGLETETTRITYFGSHAGASFAEELKKLLSKSHS